MKICVIGNSNAGALADALKSARRAALAVGDDPVDFYVVPGGEEPALRWEGERLRPINSDSRVLTNAADAAPEGLDVSPYSAVVISACGWFAHPKEFAAKHPLRSVACAHWIERDLAQRPATTQIVSSAVFEAVIGCYVRDHPSLAVAALLVDRFVGAVLLQPWPPSNRALQNDAKWFVNSWYGAAGPLVWHDYFRAQSKALKRLAEELGPKVELLDYPLPCDPAADGFMDEEWCAPDGWHANAKYGALVLDQIQEELTDSAQTREVCEPPPARSTGLRQQAQR